MHVDRILHDFTHSPHLPVKAIKAALAEPEAVTPRFLEVLSDGLPSDTGEPGAKSPLFFVVHLLGEFCEQRAFSPLMRLLASDPDRLDDEFGDAITATLPRVAFGVWNGDVTALQTLIENPEADMFLRAHMLEILAAQTLKGELDREPVVKYLLDCYATLQPQGPSYIWCGWLGAISLLGLHEFRGIARKAFRNGYIERLIMTWEHFVDDLEHCAKCSDTEALLEERRLTPFTDTAGEFAKWSGFSVQDQRHSNEWSWLAGLSRVETYINPYRAVGRNEPCPCGSGRKFKKCCLGHEDSPVAANAYDQLTPMPTQ